MPQAQASLYQNTRQFLLAHPGQYFTSEAIVEGLKLKDAKERVRMSNTLASLAQTKINRIERRQNEEGRYEYAFTGEPKSEPGASKNRSKARKPRNIQAPGKRAVQPAQKEKDAVQLKQSAGASSLKKVANFIRAYLDLSFEERREAYEWIREQRS
jgi:hypothetical protein